MKETIEIGKSDLQKLYKTLTSYPQVAQEQVKNEFEKVFNKNDLKYNIINCVKTFDDAVEMLGKSDERVKVYYAIAPLKDIPNDIKAEMKLVVICAALNDGWKPTFKDNEYRYYPWFYLYTKKEWEKLDEDEKNRRGVRFGGLASDGALCGFASARSIYAPSNADASIGSRLCLKNKDLAEYCVIQFRDIWCEYFTGIESIKYSEIVF